MKILLFFLLPVLLCVSLTECGSGTPNTKHTGMGGGRPPKPHGTPKTSSPKKSPISHVSLQNAKNIDEHVNFLGKAHQEELVNKANRELLSKRAKEYGAEKKPAHAGDHMDSLLSQMIAIVGNEKDWSREALAKVIRAAEAEITKFEHEVQAKIAQFLNQMTEILENEENWNQGDMTMYERRNKLMLLVKAVHAEYQEYKYEKQQKAKATIHGGEAKVAK